MLGPMDLRVNEPLYAIDAFELCKSYGGMCAQVPVLDRLSMKVPTGAIYGLLGPSGCGKTTLLRILMGLLGRDGGKLQVLGRPPGKPGHMVPGKRVGYMPQVMGLHTQLTIRETLMFFGRLYGMSEDRIHERIKFVIKFLQLPSTSQLFGTLSGGQQRRTSFAVALLHEPELLILDEPTVGVDPVLRNRIWDYLIGLSQNHNTTIVLTTLYVEEAKRADVVGMMRHGHLLAEASPTVLMDRFGTTTLESAFRTLCLQERIHKIDSADVQLPVIIIDDQKSKDTTREIHGSCSSECEEPFIRHRSNFKCKRIGYINYEDTLTVYDYALSSTRKAYGYAVSSTQTIRNYVTSKARSVYKQTKASVPRVKNLKAFVIRNFNVQKRNYVLLLLALIVSPPNAALVIWTLGKEPSRIPVAVVNQDTSNPFPGHLPQFGSVYLSYIGQEAFRQTQFSSLEAAKQSVREGNNRGVIHIPPSFTVDTIQTLVHLKNVSTEETDHWIHLHMDNTYVVSYWIVYKTTLQAYEVFYRNVSQKVRDLMPLTRSPFGKPYQINEPIYGGVGLAQSVIDYIGPGVLNIMVFYTPCGLTAMALIQERLLGILGRTFSTNSGTLEVIISHVLIQLPVLTVNVFQYLFIIFVVFQVTLRGSFFLTTALAFCQGIVGSMVGIILSVICDQEHMVAIGVIGMVGMCVAVTGSLWPKEALSPVLRFFAHFMPNTRSAVAFRSIILRGWGLSKSDVYMAFVDSFAWAAGLMLFAVSICKHRDS